MKNLEEMMCVSCKARQVDNTDLKMCVYCAACRNCAERPRKNKESAFCERCQCSVCGAENRKMRVNNDTRWPDGQPKRYCPSCFFKAFPERACISCKEQEAISLFWRVGEKKPTKPTVCRNCISGDARCYFCGVAVKLTFLRARIHRVGQMEYNAYCCSACRSTSSCGRNKCTPMKPCDGCIKRMNYHEPPHAVGPWLEQEVDLKRYLAGPGSRKVNRSNRLLSAEIEVAGIRAGPAGLGTAFAAIRQHVADMGGSIVFDESVPTGFEINMPPAAGDKFIDLVERTSHVLRQYGAYVNEKCGTHLHIDARDFTPLDMKKLLMLYSKIEPALLWTQPVKRVLAKRSHCYPCGKKYASLETIDLSKFSPVEVGSRPMRSKDWNKALRHTLVDAVYGGDFPRPPRHLRGNNRSISARYDALNVNSWYFQSHGTVECRLHAGTLAAKKIVAWGILWAAILDSAVRMSESEVLSLPKDEPKSVLLGIAPPNTHTYLLNRWGTFESEYKGKRY